MAVVPRQVLGVGGRPLLIGALMVIYTEKCPSPSSATLRPVRLFVRDSGSYCLLPFLVTSLPPHSPHPSRGSKSRVHPFPFGPQGLLYLGLSQELLAERDHDP